jgi:lysophospholipase L1-like esterase
MIKKLRYIPAIVFGSICLAFMLPPKAKIMVIGDSISLGYGPFLKEILIDKYDYLTKNTNENAGNLDYPTGPNAGDSHMVLSYIRDLVSKSEFRPQILLINCGLHDIKTNPETGQKAIDPSDYANNLKTIFGLLRKAGIRTIWVNSTPVNDSIHNSGHVGFFRYNKDAVGYNHIADSICRQYKVPVIDLYSYSSHFPPAARMDHVHYKPEYANLQAAYIAGFLQNIEK